MKTLLSTLVATAASACLSLGAVGCSHGTDDTASNGGAALSASLLPQVLNPVPGATAGDYYQTKQTLRLFGTQPSADGGGYATFADKSTWATRNIAVGDWLSRNYQVASITKDGVTLRQLGAPTAFAVGKDLTINAIFHRFDTAAVYQGQDVWNVSGTNFADIQTTYGTGAKGEDRSGVGPTAAIGTVSTVVLTSVDPNGVLAHAGLHTSSVLVALDGTQLHAADLDGLATALTRSGTTVSLTISEHGAVHTVTYNID